jgi:hypothetical protein
MASIASINPTDGLTLKIRVAPSFTIRTRIAILLLRSAGRVINVPCDVELVDGR